MNYPVEQAHTFSLLNILPDGIITLSPDGRIMHINLEAQVQLHINASSSEKFLAKELYLQDVLHLIHLDENIFPDILEKLNQGTRSIDLPQNTSIQDKATNALFPVKGQFFTFETDKEQKEFVFYFHNITGELTQQYILNTALQRSRIYPWFLDIDRQIFVLDARYFEYLGLPPRENNILTMQEYTNMLHPDDQALVVEAFTIQLSGNTIYEKAVAFRLRRGDGNWEWFEGQSTYIGKLSGLPYRLVGICMSIQEHKDIEEKLIAARNKAEESDKLKSAFLANMSHEIRTPLNAIVGFAEVLSDSLEELTPEERENYVSLIKANSSQLLVLISDILDLSKIESNSMEFVFQEYPLNEIFNQIYQGYKLHPLKNVELKTDIPTEETIICTDKARLKQVLNNLINNALKFTSQGQVIFGYSKRSEKEVQIFVRDTGIGISKENINRIFDRFYKVDSFKQGTGLGLSICKTIVEHLQGKINLESALHHGTCFTIDLPLYINKIENKI